MIQQNPKAGSKQISAFANTRGGILIVGITDNKELVGVPFIQQITAKIAELINPSIQPSPRYHLITHHENTKDYLIIHIGEGPATPYYYTSRGTCIAYIRAGDQSVVAPPHHLNTLIPPQRPEQNIRCLTKPVQPLRHQLHPP